MAKKIDKVLKLNLSAGTATPAPPVGPILGQAGINMMDFLKQYNDKTKDQKGQIIPAEITVFQDKSFTFVLKIPPVSDLIKQAIKIKKGSGKNKTEPIGTISQNQIREIATKKLPDLNTSNIESAVKTVTGTARSMGVTVN